MAVMAEPLDITLETLSDVELAARAAARDPRAIRLVTARNNQRLYRAAWSILRNRQDAEEVVQEAYCKAFTGSAPLTTSVRNFAITTCVSPLFMSSIVTVTFPLP